MKRYVFFTNSIRNMGGAQMYLRNKMLFLKEHGWTPSVYFFNDGNILIPELKEYEANRIPELAFPLTAVGHHQRERVINRILNDFSSTDECVFESHIYPQCYWVEEIAKRLKGRNLLYILHENFPKINSNEENYLKFKYERGEFMNRTQSIESLIGKHWVKKTQFIMPSYSNVTSPIYYPIDYDKSLKTILSIGRLDKPYIFPMLKEIVFFTEKTRLKINLFMVGGAAEDSIINSIKKYLKDKSLIVPHFFGYMFPVPENLIKACDVAIASAGSVLVPAEQGIPTISIDTQDYNAIGIYGETTDNIYFRSDEELVNTSDLLYEVLVENKYQNVVAKPSKPTLESEKILKEHLDIIESLNATREYYDVFSVYNKNEIFKQRAKAFIYRFLGESGSEVLSRIKKLITNKNK